MGVLIEAISVVIRMDRLSGPFDDWEAFKAYVPNGTLCADSELARVGFMAPDDVFGFCAVLEGCGLHHLIDGKAQDFVVVDQQQGPASRCDWIEFGRVHWGGDPNRPTPVCRLKGSEITTIMVPDGWEWERSLLSSFKFIPLGEPLPDEVFISRTIYSAKHLSTGVAENSDHGFGVQVLAVPDEPKSKAAFFGRLLGRRDKD